MRVQNRQNVFKLLAGNNDTYWTLLIDRRFDSNVFVAEVSK